jgi:hypothetical protein
MEENHSTNGLTRRSFIKRSVVTAVAVSSITIFSGLVKANPATNYPEPNECKIDTSKGCINTDDGINGQGYYCPCTKTNGTIKVFGAKCENASGRNPTSLC